MKKCFAIIPLALLMIFIVTALSTYDNFDDSSFNTALWNTFNVTDSGAPTFTLVETENLSIGVSLEAAKGSISVSSTASLSGDFEVNWTVLDLNGGGGAPNWAAAWVQIGDKIITGYNVTGNDGQIWNMTDDADANETYNLKYVAGEYILRNQTGIVRTIPEALSGVLNFTARVSSGGSMAMTFIFDKILFDSGTFGITLVSPNDDTTTTNGTIPFNVSQGASSPTELTNSTTYIWYSNGTLFNSTFFNVTGLSNSTGVNVDFSTINSYTWNADECLNNNTCISGTNRTLSWGITNVTSIKYNTTEYELFTTNYGMQIDSIATSVTATLWFNGTPKSTTTSNVAGNTWNINASFIPTSTNIKNNSIFFEIDADGLNYNTSLNSQWGNGSILSLCNSTLSVPFINITFKNETTAAEYVTALVSSSSWYYYGDNSSIFKSLSFSNATENNWYAFCFSANKTLNTNVSFLYDNAISEQRTWEESSLSLTNTVTNKLLYLLPSSEGIFVTFQVINSAEEVIEGVFANATTSGGILAGSDYTDSAGLVTFFLDPDESYTFIFEKTGYTTYTTTLTPTQASYTVVLATGETTEINDYHRGISYSISPTNNSIANNTAYDFWFYLSSDYWTVDSFGFTLSNETGVLGSTSASSNGGNVSLNQNTYNYTMIRMDYFWEINGNYSNLSITWVVRDTTGSGYGLNNFFTRLREYVNPSDGSTGIFGINSFTLSLLVFFVIFISTGLISYKFGITSPAAVLGILFAFTLFFNAGLGIVPPGTQSISQLKFFPTIIVGILLIGAIIRENIR